jgi:hypothetical protein
MNQYEKDQYELRLEIDGRICECGKPAECRCHRMNNSRMNIAKYGIEIIGHNMNIVIGCQGCNSKYSISNKPLKIERLVNLINYFGKDRLKKEEIDRIIK